MYRPAHFDETRAEELELLIESCPLGALVTVGPQGLDANHLPFLHEPARDGAPGRLLAHVARANPVWREMSDGAPVLVIFRAGESYVSPNWYPSKHALHRQVPTWNYQVVHVHGTLRIHDDERFVRGVVARLTRIHEARAGEQKPWRMSDSEPAYIDSMIAAVVGIEIAIQRIEGKSKLSQNKETRDRENMHAVLEARGETMLAQAVARSLNPEQS